MSPQGVQKGAGVIMTHPDAAPPSPATAGLAGLTPVVSIQQITKHFGNVQALTDLSVTIGEGITGLVGANGAGKSTLIKILLGLLAPTSGQAWVLGHDIGSKSLDIRANVGYMPEHDCLPPDVSASEFLVHMAHMSGLPHHAARERAADVLRHVGLLEERYRPMGTYSTGMKQRAKLGQALVHDPKLVFLDEPTNGLDPTSRDDMLHLIRRIGHDFGIAVVVTSHLLGELERISDNVIVIDSGRLLRASAISGFLDSTGTVLVEVMGEGDAQHRMGEALAAAGLRCQPRGRLIAIDPPPESQACPSVHDVVRDTAVELGVGVVRIAADHRRLEDVFRPGVPPEQSSPQQQVGGGQ